MIGGEQPSPSNMHRVYVALEATKLALLVIVTVTT